MRQRQKLAFKLWAHRIIMVACILILLFTMLSVFGCALTDALLKAEHDETIKGDRMDESTKVEAPATADSSTRIGMTAIDFIIVAGAVLFGAPLSYRITKWLILRNR